MTPITFYSLFMIAVGIGCYKYITNHYNNSNKTTLIFQRLFQLATLLGFIIFILDQFLVNFLFTF